MNWIPKEDLHKYLGGEGLCYNNWTNFMIGTLDVNPSDFSDYICVKKDQQMDEVIYFIPLRELINTIPS